MRLRIDALRKGVESIDIVTDEKTQVLDASGERVMVAVDHEIAVGIPEFHMALAEEAEIAAGSAVVRGDRQRAGSDHCYQVVERDRTVGIQRKAVGAGPTQGRIDFD